MEIIFKGEYKSLESFEWKNIPKLVVITGVNGSGKTQLLELIYHSIKKTSSNLVEGELSTPPYKFDKNEVVYLKGDWGIDNMTPIDIATMQSQHKALYQNAFANFDNPRAQKNQFYRESDEKKEEYDAFTRYLNKSKRYLVTYEEFSERYPKNLLIVDVPIHKQINNVFFQYRMSQLDAASKGLQQEYIIKTFGQAPWTVLRDIISVSKLPFSINDAADCGPWDQFELRLTHQITNKEIKFADLSSGEKILLSLVFYLYQSQEKGIFPKLLLMDEPDAHLHPTMTQQFFNVVKDVLVDKFDIQVLMSTHNPSTVMLAPENALYEMSISSPRIQLSPSKNHSVSILTSGLIYVGEGTRYFLVEDQADVDFYSYINNQLLASQQITPDIPLVFIKASTNDTAGGKNVVSAWVDKLRSSGLTNIIHGLIDKDLGNMSGNGIFTIDRYSIENYLIDPLVIYTALLDTECAPVIAGVSLSMGQEYILNTLPPEKLQFLSDHILSLIEQALSCHFESWNSTKISVKFINGVSLMYPLWLMQCRGKTILNSICNKVFGSKINQGSLFKAFKRLNLIPVELTEKFSELKK